MDCGDVTKSVGVDASERTAGISRLRSGCARCGLSPGRLCAKPRAIDRAPDQREQAGDCASANPSASLTDQPRSSSSRFIAPGGLWPRSSSSSTVAPGAAAARGISAGQSSGGHLAAVALTTDWPREFALPADIIKGGMCISGMYDLTPVPLSARNRYLKFDDANPSISQPRTIGRPPRPRWPSRRSLICASRRAGGRPRSRRTNRRARRQARRNQGNTPRGSGRAPLRGAWRHYLCFATTRVRSAPIGGERISTMSPGFRKRSGADEPSANKSLESAAVPAAVPPLMMSPG